MIQFLVEQVQHIKTLLDKHDDLCDLTGREIQRLDIDVRDIQSQLQSQNNATNEVQVIYQYIDGEYDTVYHSFMPETVTVEYFIQINNSWKWRRFSHDEWDYEIDGGVIHLSYVDAHQLFFGGNITQRRVVVMGSN